MTTDICTYCGQSGHNAAACPRRHPAKVDGIDLCAGFSTITGRECDDRLRCKRHAPMLSRDSDQSAPPAMVFAILRPIFGPCLSFVPVKA